MRIATDMLQLAYEDKYDTGILVSGDGDFVPVIQMIHNLSLRNKPRKKIQAASFDNELRRCFDIKEHAYSFINLDYIIPAVLKAKKP